MTEKPEIEREIKLGNLKPFAPRITKRRECKGFDKWIRRHALLRGVAELYYLDGASELEIAQRFELNRKTLRRLIGLIKAI